MDSGSKQDQTIIFEIVQYMGLEGQMDWWMKNKGYIPQDPVTKSTLKEGITEDAGVTNPVNQAPTIFQQYAGTVHCMWLRPDPSNGKPTLPVQTIGLRPDGSVWATANTATWNIEAILNWRNIVSVCSIWTGILIGLKADGTIVSFGIKKDHPINQTIAGWRDITAISGGMLHLLGLRKDGTVIVAHFTNPSDPRGQCNVGDWQDIVAIAAGAYHSVGLRANGTVVAVGDNSLGQCNVSRWRNITAISGCANHTLGLTKEGQAIVTHKDKPEGLFSTEKNVVGVSAGNGHFLLLKADGTVSAYGSDEFRQCQVSEWKDIVAVAAGDKYSIGVKSDGTLKSTGKDEFGETYVSAGYGTTVGPYSPQLAQALKEADARSAAWKAAGLCPFCGGTISWISKKCKSCKRSVG